MEKPINIIFLGDPGSGKATQGPLIVKKYDLFEFDFGEWLRELKDPEEKKKFNMTEIHQGNLALSDPACEVFRNIILTTPKNKGILFNGNPKAFVEAQAMEEAFREAKRRDPMVIYIKISYEEMMHRLEIRNRATGRKDDKGIENRIKYYKEEVSEVVKYFKKRYCFQEISGMGTEKEVSDRLINAIEHCIKTNQV